MSENQTKLVSILENILSEVNYLWNHAYYHSPCRDEYITDGLDNLGEMLEKLIEANSDQEEEEL